MTKLDFEKKHLTRSKGGYTPYPNYGVKYLNTFFPYISKLWNNLNTSTQSMALSDCKLQLKSNMKPDKIKHFSNGSKIGNILLTRIRLDRSDLNLHKFTIGHSDSPQCMCHAKQESSLHFMIDCFLYSNERQTLFDLVEQLYPKFKSLSKIRKYEALVMGINTDNPDYKYVNTNITYAVQNFIMKTKRFSEYLKLPPPALPPPSCSNFLCNILFNHLSNFCTYFPLHCILFIVTYLY